jgi:hypothetical protein
LITRSLRNLQSLLLDYEVRAGVYNANLSDSDCNWSDI